VSAIYSVHTLALLPEALVGAAAAASLLGLGSGAPRTRPWVRRWAGRAALGVIAVALALELWLGAWVGTLFGGGVSEDRFALFAKAMVLVALGVAVAATDWDLERLPGALPFGFLGALGVMTAASATSLPALWGGLALSVAAGTAAAARPGRGELSGLAAALGEGAARAAVTAAALVFVAGLAFAYLAATAGTSSLDGVRAALAGEAATLPVAVPVLVAMAALAALLLLAPFGLGSGAPAGRSPLGGGLAGAVVAAGAGVVLVKLAAATGGVGPGWSPAVIAVGAAASLLGGLAALAPRGPRALLGALGASQLGWVLVGAGVADQQSLGGGLFLLGAAVVALGAAPVLLEGLEADPAGLAARAPGRAAGLALAALSLAGAPPLAGFFGLFAVADAAGQADAYWAVGLAGLGSVLAVVGAARFGHLLFLETEVEERRGRPVRGVRSVAPTTLAAGGAAALAVFVIAYGIFANPISGLAIQGAEALGLR
jgi:NADH-quinone oxidoreductase subunit N